MEGLLSSIYSVVGPSAKPTSIQALSLKHLFSPLKPGKDGQLAWRQYLLASETGSGKSIAYLLPMLQDLKRSENEPRIESESSPRRALNPRGLVLAPTHELSRQLSGFAKSLLHNVKLRVMCASRTNVPSVASRTASAAQMAVNFDGKGDGTGEFVLSGKEAVSRDVDVLVGTPTKVLEMVKGRGWDWEKRAKEREEEGKGEVTPRRKWTIGEPEAGLANVEWVVIDEADVLLDPDFQESTRLLLADIAAARGHPVKYQPELNLSSIGTNTPVEVPEYPFNLLLTTATIPSSLAAYLDAYHPSLTRLASPNLHKLPATLKTEYEGWTGGRRNKDIERKIRRVWWEDAVAAAKPGALISAESLPAGSPKSKILIFCNKSSKVEDLGTYLREMGISNVALTSTSETRQRGSNKHLDGFLRVRDVQDSVGLKPVSPDQPHVLITTSLLSRGLDFCPSIRHVFIVDSPRNMVDFLHRAGRSGRAGEKGKVVVFGKEKGRGAGRDKEMKSRVRAVAR
ncbi:P-loop containing nucleoside triphosphate hydrolase protein [Cristinia sonorae]|uniref:RNA helicase n=1 Tax=Cristinia sonorae TaxID=1940300 RepID=A0A8K0UJD1_9AGAR|nr:P-loop containing nucleoside triphosphate hydrolase protein [Cristinia sonorae]